MLMGRTNIVIDDALLQQAKEISGAPTMRETVDLALRQYVRLHHQGQIRALRGTVEWVGNLDELRRTRGDWIAST